jgi:hypothetical protein
MPTKKIYWLAPVLLVAMALVLTGCGKSASEKAAEKIIEKSTNGQAQVDVDNNQVTINTNAGTYQAGEEVKLPSGFPSDIYVIDGTIKAAMTNVENNGYTLSIETSKSVTEAKELYDTKLKDDGWAITMSLVYEGAASIGATKDNRTTTIGISTASDKTTVVLSTSENSN